MADGRLGGLETRSYNQLNHRCNATGIQAFTSKIKKDPRSLTGGLFCLVRIIYSQCQSLGGISCEARMRIWSEGIMNARSQLRHRHLPKGWNPSVRSISVLRHLAHAFTS